MLHEATVFICKEITMYGGGSGDVFSLVSGGVVTASSVVASGSVIAGHGVVVLPNTGASLAATILAYTAITIGSLALMSQVTVRVLKRIYR